MILDISDSKKENLFLHQNQILDKQFYLKKQKNKNKEKSKKKKKKKKAILASELNSKQTILFKKRHLSNSN